MKYFQYSVNANYSNEDFEDEVKGEKNMIRDFEQRIMDICEKSASTDEKFQRYREYSKKINYKTRGK